MIFRAVALRTRLSLWGHLMRMVILTYGTGNVRLLSTSVTLCLIALSAREGLAFPVTSSLSGSCGALHDCLLSCHCLCCTL